MSPTSFFQRLRHKEERSGTRGKENTMTAKNCRAAEARFDIQPAQPGAETSWLGHVKRRRRNFKPFGSVFVPIEDSHLQRGVIRQERMQSKVMCESIAFNQKRGFE